MLYDHFRSSRKYSQENEYDAGTPMPMVFEQTVADDIYSPDGNKETSKFRYVQEEEFTKILKLVKRNKKKEQDDREWLKLLNERKIACKFNTESDESESLTSSALSVSAQNVVQKYCGVGLKRPVSGHVHNDCQKYCDALSNKAGSEAYVGTRLDISDTGKREEICTREENVSVVQKTNIENVQMIKLLSHPKFSKHIGNMSLATIQEEALCLPNSHCCMLNGTECFSQHRPCHMNKNYVSDMPKSLHEHHVIEKKSYNVVPSDVAKLNPYAISKESILSQRISFIQKKMNTAIDDILTLYNKIPEPDGNQDLLRRCKRAAEFSCRFSRNYLYQLRQQVCELKKLIRESSSLSTAQHTLRQLVFRKLAVAHHSALQGLQAYLHHMPSSVQCAAGDKLKELLHYICELSRLCSRVEIESAYSSSELGPDCIEKKSKALLHLVNSKNFVNKFEDGFLASHNTAVNIMTTSGKKEWESSLREPEQTQVPMISIKGQCSAKKIISWKESAAKLAKEMYGSPAKNCGSAAFKRSQKFSVSKVIAKDGPPVQFESELKMSGDPTSLIDMRNLSNERTGVCGEEFPNKLQSVLRKTEVLQENVKSFDGQSSAPLDDMKPVLQQQSQNQHTAQRKDDVKFTKIGPQNAKLIILPPDPHDTLLDSADNKASEGTRQRSQDTTFMSEANDTLNHNVHCEHKSRACCKLKSNIQIMNSVKSKNVYHHHRPEDSPELHCFKKPSRKTSTHANIKDNARRKSRIRVLSQLTLPKKDIQSAVDYHRKFHSYMTSNPMYENTISPWVMISRLSDQLIEKILQEVARETKLESLVQNIYTLELQEEKYFSGSHH